MKEGGGINHEIHELHENRTIGDLCKTSVAASRQRAALFNLLEKCGGRPTAATMKGRFAEVSIDILCIPFVCFVYFVVDHFRSGAGAGLLNKETRKPGR
jgi:hypothetical protein